MTTALVTTYTTSKGAIINLTVSGYSFNLYDAITYGGETRYVNLYSGSTTTMVYPGAQFASSPLGSNVTISTPTAGTITRIDSAMNTQAYIAGVYEDPGKTLSITYNGETLTGGTWISPTNSWVFMGQTFTTPPPVGTVVTYQYVSPPPPPPPGQTYIPTEGRVPEVDLVPAKENRVLEGDLTPDVRDVPRTELVPNVINKGNLIPS